MRARRRWNQNVINTRETATARRGRAGRRRGPADAALLSTDTRAAARRAHGGASEPCPSVGASCGIKELPQVGVQGKEGAPERHLRSGGEEEIQDGFSPSLV